MGLALLGILSACSQDRPQKPAWTVAEVKALESKLRDMNQLDTALADSLAQGYKALAQRDTLSEKRQAEYWLRRGDVYRAFGGRRDRQALEAYRRVVDSFAYSEQAAQAALASGLLFERRGNTQMAAGAYRLIIDRFPSSPLADDAQNLLDLVRKSPGQQKELIQSWIRKSDTSQSPKGA